jgi:cyclopropane-fatty-acyl-phospholipid synthase
LSLGSKGGMAAAQTESWVGESGGLLSNPKPMEASLMEAGARLLVTSFLGRYISTGSLM